MMLPTEKESKLLYLISLLLVNREFCQTVSVLIIMTRIQYGTDMLKEELHLTPIQGQSS